jgi:hypothetical protein
MVVIVGGVTMAMAMTVTMPVTMPVLETKDADEIDS